jgi:hypothetical protein
MQNPICQQSNFPGILIKLVVFTKTNSMGTDPMNFIVYRLLLFKNVSHRSTFCIFSISYFILTGIALGFNSIMGCRKIDFICTLRILHFTLCTSDLNWYNDRPVLYFNLISNFVNGIFGYIQGTNQFFIHLKEPPS